MSPQVLSAAAVNMLQPFLEPGQDVIVSVESVRMQLLALSTLCPGASTLLANLLHTSSVRPSLHGADSLADTRWLKAFVAGCAHALFSLPLPPRLDNTRFHVVAEALYGATATGVVLVGA